MGMQSAVQKRSEESPSEGETEAQPDNLSLPRLGSGRAEIRAQSPPLASPECWPPGGRSSQLRRVPAPPLFRLSDYRQSHPPFSLMCEHTPWEFTATAKKSFVQRSPSTLC